MESATEKMSALKAAIESRPDDAAAIDGTYLLELDGDGGGRWLLNLRQPVSVEAGGEEAECHVRLSADDFVALVSGQVSAQQLFFSGRLRVEGDLGLAIRLQKLPALLHPPAP